jgi:hypothetical protein
MEAQAPVNLPAQRPGKQGKNLSLQSKLNNNSNLAAKEVSREPGPATNLRLSEIDGGIPLGQQKFTWQRLPTAYR